ncbi:AlpA family transcriptional regulator [Kineosporia sp. A_224]|uniref:helix-turn-helix transcriptional regulator n=1 Tax=Kineosporia sp. A_224 TaxID=1962180 RepID=UPI001303FC4D|nr:helix-turn-helix domain-containing protein [Kineosporia sp. A_224]
MSDQPRDAKPGKRATPNPDPLLTKAAACEYLGGITPPTLDRWVAKGRLPKVKYGPGRGSAVRFRRSDLDKFLNESVQTS